LYLDAPSWTPDSKRSVFRRGASDDGSHTQGTWLCDTEDNLVLPYLVWVIVESSA